MSIHQSVPLLRRRTAQVFLMMHWQWSTRRFGSALIFAVVALLNPGLNTRGRLLQPLRQQFP